MNTQVFDVEYREYEESYASTDEQVIDVIEIQVHQSDIALLQAEAGIPQKWDRKHEIQHIAEARLMLTRPAVGRAHTVGHHSLTVVIINEKEVYLLLDSGASCSVVGSRFLTENHT